MVSLPPTCRQDKNPISILIVPSTASDTNRGRSLGLIEHPDDPVDAPSNAKEIDKSDLLVTLGESLEFLDEIK